MWFKKNVSNKKKWLAKQIKKPINNLATQCGHMWESADRVTELLAQNSHKIPHCNQLYAMSTDYIQKGASTIKNKVDIRTNGYNHTDQPYTQGNLPFRGLVLTNAYINSQSIPSITVIQAVNHNEKLLGFLAADFDMRQLPVDNILTPQYPWQQFKGDPSIRNTVFMQKRSQSELDKNIDLILDDMFNLFCDHGVFHSVIHFSSSLCTLRLNDAPYDEQIHNIDELINPELFLLYPRKKYPEKALVAPAKIVLVLTAFKTLRNIDDTFYLRTASLNIMNNMVNLTFSCDGSHYMTVDEFLEKESGFWGEAPLQAIAQ